MKKKIKRDQILYVRITKSNKKWVKETAKHLNYSESEFINILISRKRFRNNLNQKFNDTK